MFGIDHDTLGNIGLWITGVEFIAVMVLDIWYRIKVARMIAKNPEKFDPIVAIHMLAD